MKESDAKELMCPNRFRTEFSTCRTTKCMAWVPCGHDTVKNEIGYCTKYGEDSIHILVDNLHE